MKTTKLNNQFGVPAAIALTVILAGYAAPARAANVSELLIECGGKYQVLESTPYFESNEGTRKPPQAGTHEKIQVLSIEGPDCDVLATDYGIKIAVGDTFQYGVSTFADYAKAKSLAAQRLGATFDFEAFQHFSFIEGQGELPLFPLVHREWVSMLGFSGIADAAKRYGTPKLADLSDAQKAQILDKAFWKLDWGKGLEDLLWSKAEWLELVLNKDIAPSAEWAVKEYITDLSLIFSNVSNDETGFTTLSPGAKVGARLNELLNAHGGGKFQDKVATLKNQPLLFADQIVSWAAIGIPSKLAFPVLTPAELEEVLVSYLDQAERLSHVPELVAARIRLAQFKAAAAAIQNVKVFDPSAESKALLAEILELK